jgi:hypothetical protein
MKLMNTKTAILMFSSVVLLALSGCGSEGTQSDTQLVGSGNTAPVANAGDAQLHIMESSSEGDYYIEPSTATDAQKVKEETTLPEEESADLKTEESSSETSMDTKMSVRQDRYEEERKDQNVTVTLDGSASFDADGDELTYSWTLVSKPGRSEMVFGGSDTVTATFDADVMGYYTFDLVVNDGTVDSLPSRVTISVKAYRVELIQTEGDNHNLNEASSTMDTRIAYPGSSNHSSNDSNRSFTYNEYGQVLTENYVSTCCGGQINEYTYTYDENGNRLTETRVYKDSVGNVNWSNEKDSAGNVNWSNESTYAYDENGNRLTETHVNKDSAGNVTSSYESTYAYDENGNRLTETHVSKDSAGNVTSSSEYTYTYDENGNRLTETYVYKDSTGNVTSSSKSTYTWILLP